MSREFRDLVLSGAIDIDAKAFGLGKRGRGQGLLPRGQSMASLAPKLQGAIASTSAASRHGYNAANSAKLSRRKGAYKRLLRTRPEIARAERQRQNW